MTDGSIAPFLIIIASDRMTYPIDRTGITTAEKSATRFTPPPSRMTVSAAKTTPVMIFGTPKLTLSASAAAELAPCFRR